MEDTEDFLTSDLALATTLNLEGIKHHRLVYKRGKAFWCFIKSGVLVEVVADYQDGSMEVEPRGYNTMLAQVRNEMYDFVAEHRDGSR